MKYLNSEISKTSWKIEDYFEDNKLIKFCYRVLRYDQFGLDRPSITAFSKYSTKYHLYNLFWPQICFEEEDFLFMDNDIFNQFNKYWQDKYQSFSDDLKLIKVPEKEFNLANLKKLILIKHIL